MKFTPVFFVLALPTTAAFSVTSSFTGASSSLSAPSNGRQMSMEYIPSGMTKAQWEKVKEQERKRNEGKNLGKVGITTFKSRSFADWQKSGGKNLFPVDPTKVKDPKDIPYMQRPGGMPDDSDLKKPNPFMNLFGKKKEPEPEVEEPKKTNWWNLS